MESLVVTHDPKEDDGIENCTTGYHAQEHATAEHSGPSHHLKDYGTFMGHFNPGVLFTVYGLLWTYNVIKRYQIARREAVLTRRDPNKLNFQCSLFSQYYDGCCSRVPVEAFALVVGTTMGLFGELKSGFRDGTFHIATMHHMCMFFFYDLVGVTNILMHKKYALPLRSDLALFIIASLIEAFLFSGHVAGRNNVNKQVHILLIYSILGTVVFSGLELLYPSSVLASLGRTLSLTIHGQWFWAVGFILYPPSSLLPKLDQEDHGSMALISTLFVTLIASVIISAFITNYVIVRQVIRLSLPTINRMQSKYYGQNLSAASASDPEKPLISDSDCE
ncbi:Protein of unknown function DUF716 (TMEM45) [Trinorchestia longiramus]|nr:Protein of unknown function DUF716 (TMEM45) [Trinorchestia longiramus]